MGREDRSINRRKLLSTVAPAALVLSGVAAAAPVTVNPDAQLLGLCAEYEALYHEIDAANVGATLATEDGIYEAMTGRRDEQDAIIPAIVAAPPTTPAGFAAVVGLLVLREPWSIESSQAEDTDAWLRLALYRGILGRNAA